MGSQKDATRLRSLLWSLPFLVGGFLTDLPVMAQAAEGRAVAESLQSNVVLVKARFHNGGNQPGFGILVAERNSGPEAGTWIVVPDHVVRRVDDGPVEPAIEVKVQYYCKKGEWYSAKLLTTRKSKPFDVAVLQAQSPGCSWERRSLAPLTEEDQPGSPVWFIGLDADWVIPRIEGKIQSRVPDENSKVKAEIRDPLKGSSGAPFVSEDGIAAMVLNGNAKSVVEAISMHRIRYFFVSVWRHPWDLVERESTRSIVSPELSGAHSWPVVFQEDLMHPSLPASAVFALGQYGEAKSFAPVGGEGLRIGGAHTRSVAWWDCPLQPPLLVSAELKLERLDLVRPAFWLRGSGYGLSAESAYFLSLANGRELSFTKSGKPIGPSIVNLSAPLVVGKWYGVDILVLPKVTKLFVKGNLVGEWADPEPFPEEPLHAFAGLGAEGGATYTHEPSAAVFRKLKLRAPAGASCGNTSQARQLDPPVVSEAVKSFPACDSPALEIDFTRPDAKGWKAYRDSDGAKLTLDGLRLKGPNMFPSVWLENSFRNDFVLECSFSYPASDDSVNFRLMLSLGETGDRLKDRFDGWSLELPSAEGALELRRYTAEEEAEDFWKSRQQSVLWAKTPYYAPINGRTYLIRIERDQGVLRVWSNGGRLFEIPNAWGVNPDQPVHVGLGQIYGGSLVKAIKVWHRCPPAGTKPAGE